MTLGISFSLGEKIDKQLKNLRMDGKKFILVKKYIENKRVSDSSHNVQLKMQTRFCIYHFKQFNLTKTTFVTYFEEDLNKLLENKNS